MAEGELKITITEQRRIFKYAEGVSPEEGEPFEVLSNTRELTGEEAKKYLEQLNKGELPNADA